MIKSSSLYIVIVISLLIAITTASLLTIAFYYRMETLKKIRFDRLQLNVQSGTEMLLSGEFNRQEHEGGIDLYGYEKDSVILKKQQWGVFNLNIVAAFELRDTLRKAFLSGCTFNDPNAIYLADEDRPLSVSGSTKIIGDGQIPKAGLKQAYVDGKPYAGGKELIKGNIINSNRDLPALNKSIVKNIVDLLVSEEGAVFNVHDSLKHSFFEKELIYRLNIGDSDLTGRSLIGKIILVSDTIVKIDQTTHLQNVQIYAPAIIVSDHFTGTCQLFARDSIMIGKNCTFNYPSFAGVFKAEEAEIQPKISLGEGCVFSGILLSYESKRSPLQTIISFAKNCLIKGEIYASGHVKMEKGFRVNGKVSAKRFIMQTPATLYENYLIDIYLNRKLLSKYYLSTLLFNSQEADQQILQWLN